MTKGIDGMQERGFVPGKSEALCPDRSRRRPRPPRQRERREPRPRLEPALTTGRRAFMSPALLTKALYKGYLIGIMAFAPVHPPWRMAYRYVEATGHAGALDRILADGIPPKDPSTPFVWMTANFFRFGVEAEEFLVMPGKAEAGIYIDLREHPEPLQWKRVNQAMGHDGGGLECELPVQGVISAGWIVEYFRTESPAGMAPGGNPGTWLFQFVARP